MTMDIPDEDEEEADYQKEIKANRKEYRDAYAGFQSLQGLISDLDGGLFWPILLICCHSDTPRAIS